MAKLRQQFKEFATRLIHISSHGCTNTIPCLGKLFEADQSTIVYPSNRCRGYAMDHTIYTTTWCQVSIQHSAVSRCVSVATESSCTSESRDYIWKIIVSSRLPLCSKHPVLPCLTVVIVIKCELYSTQSYSGRSMLST